MNIKQQKKNDNYSGIYFGWFVVGGAFLLAALTCGAFYSFGVFFMPVVKDFGWSRGTVSGVVFTMAFTYALTVPLSGLLADKYGFRNITMVTVFILGLGYFLGYQVDNAWQMYLFVGLLPGLGAGSSLALPLAMVSRWFIRRQGLALGIAASGIGVGGMIMPLLTTYIIEETGWRSAFFLLGIFIWLTCIPVSFFVMREPDADYLVLHEKPAGHNPEIEGHENSEKSFDLSEALTTSAFWLIFGVFLLASLCLGLTMTHIAPYAQDRGLSVFVAAGLLSTMGFFSFIGRILTGLISDKTGAKPVLLICLILQCALMFWLIFSDNPWMLYLFAVLFSLSYAGNIVLIPKLTAAVFGTRSMGSIFSGISVADGLGFAFGPLLAGLLFDFSGTYISSFVLVALGVIGAVLMLACLKEKLLIEKPTK